MLGPSPSRGRHRAALTVPQGARPRVMPVFQGMALAAGAPALTAWHGAARRRAAPAIANPDRLRGCRSRGRPA